ncbi:helix-turn-helix transcriptional regulator [Aliiroseovarius marinus]|uniref:helix-turn-helix transcriptional regulator n=1 Tax=Aliiroseovarius marinus TaxID=2500159 RepID=UPI002493D8FC|nr:helix-turn-helix domain-containing protein [Aliiroseovarius marinus]
MAHSHEAVADGYHTIPQAAKRLGIPTTTLRRAVNKGLVPFHRPFSQRIRVRLSEIIAVIEAQKLGVQVDE